MEMSWINYFVENSRTFLSIFNPGKALGLE